MLSANHLPYNSIELIELTKEGPFLFAHIRGKMYKGDWNNSRKKKTLYCNIVLDATSLVDEDADLVIETAYSLN